MQEQLQENGLKEMRWNRIKQTSRMTGKAEF